MTGEIVSRVLSSRRYRDVDVALVERLAAEELPRSRGADDAVKRVKRRLHQAVGAFGGSDAATDAIADAWRGDMGDTAFRAVVLEALGAHASTRERVPHLDRFYAAIWDHTGVPGRVIDLGCGLGPLALPWMGLDPAARYVAVDVDRRALDRVEAFLDLVGQPHEARALDLVSAVPDVEADVALALKLVTTLDRQERSAASRLLASIRAPRAVVSFTTRSLGGHELGMERTYRSRLDRLVDDVPRVTDVAEASAPNELVFIVTLGLENG